MRTLLPLALLALPFLDIASLIKAGALFGFFPTLGLVIGAGLVGSWLVQHQGLAIGRSVRQTLADNRVPVVEAFDGACLLVAGGLFMFPGFVSDVFALLLLIPAVRAGLRRMIGRSLREQGAATVVWTTTADGFNRPMAGGDVIDGEYEVVHPANDSAATSPPRPPRVLPGNGAKAPPSPNGPPKIVRPDDPC